MFNDTAERDFVSKPTPFFVSRRRKDGRYMVKYNFLAKQIRKIETADKVANLRSDSGYKEGRWS